MTASGWLQLSADTSLLDRKKQSVSRSNIAFSKGYSMTDSFFHQSLGREECLTADTVRDHGLSKLLSDTLIAR